MSFDNDSTVAVVLAQDRSALEDGPNNNILTTARGRFEFYLATPSTTDTTVFFTLGGTATNNVDYMIFTEDPGTKADPAMLTLSDNAGSIVIPKNTTGPKSLWVVGQDDNLSEGDEGVTITLNDTNNAAITGDTTATVFVVDNDSTVFLTFNDLTDQTANEENPSDMVRLFVGLTQQSSQPSVVRFSTGGTGSSAAEFNTSFLPGTYGHDDYTIVGATPDLAFFPHPATGRYEYTVTIPAWTSSAVFQVRAIDDDPGSSGTGVVEGTEFVNIWSQTPLPTTIRVRHCGKLIQPSWKRMWQSSGLLTTIARPRRHMNPLWSRPTPKQ